jgi:hypothetical protein
MVDDEGIDHEMPDGSLSAPEIEEQSDLERRYFAFHNGRTDVDLTPEELVRFRELNISSREKCLATMAEWVKTKPRPVCCQCCAGFWDRWSFLQEVDQ